MERSKHVNAFWELDVYREAFAAAGAIYELTKHFPKEERYSLVSQIRRSSRSVGAQIAEAWGKRRYQRHFVSKLTDADAEQLETQHWVRTARSCNLITDNVEHELLTALSRIGRMLQTMITKSDQFCGEGDHTIRESPAVYAPTAHYDRSPMTDNRSPITDHR